MPETLLLLILSCLAGLAFTYLARPIAQRFGLTDHPDGHRKLHGKPIPLGGGVAIFLAMLLVLAGGILANPAWRTAFELRIDTTIGLLFAGIIVVAVGIADDYRLLRGRQKLLGQLAAALVLVASGLSIETLQIFDWRIELSLLSVPFTVFWLLGAMNALNLLDGIDGLASTVGIILAGTIAFMAALAGQTVVVLIALALVGSLLGFLRFNFPPATIFLGDAGSMLIGLLVGTLAIQASLKGPGTVLLAAPLAVWAIPIFDSAAAVLRRKLTGRSLYSTDRAHLHHRLMERLGSNAKTLAVVALCCVATCAAALLSVYSRNDLIALITSLGVITILIATRVFGHTELALASSRLVRFSRSLARLDQNGNGRTYNAAIHLQGNREWESLWKDLTESAGQLRLSEIRLDVNLPYIHEGYHASWRHSPCELDRQWRLAMPLVVSDSIVGSLLIAGDHNGGSAAEGLEELLELLQVFEKNLTAMTGEPEPREPTPLVATISMNHQSAAAHSTCPTS